MAKFCTNCGTPVNENTKFCGECGAPVDAAAPAAAARPAAKASTAIDSEPLLTPKVKKILIWCGIALVVIAFLCYVVTTAINRSIRYGMSMIAGPGTTSSILEGLLRFLFIRLF